MTTHSTLVTHSHVFLADTQNASERKTWAVIWLCGTMMVVEIITGLLFGSIALVADGMHMSTHAGALLLAALAYSYSRRHAADPRFTFGTGKLGDLAGFTSAIILAMISLLIAYDSAMRVFAPVAIHLAEAIPIACLGLAVNVGSVWLLSGHQHHGHSQHGHQHHGHQHHGHQHSGHQHHEHHPHDVHEHEQEHAKSVGQDNNMRAAVIHVVADAAVSVLVIVGLLLALGFGWLWVDPLVGFIGACVIASWAFGLIRDTAGVLLDMNPDRRMTDALRGVIESEGDRLADFHLWRLGPGHLGAIVSVVTPSGRTADYYRERLARFRSLSHLTIEVIPDEALPSRVCA